MNTSKQDLHTEEKPANNSKFRSIQLCLPVIIVFFVVTVIAWLIPFRPTMSETEKRNLEKFPEFSVQVLFDGSYFDDIGVWFSDTFTFRDAWMKTATNLESLYGTKDVVIYGEMGDMDDIPDINITAPNVSEPTPTSPGETQQTETTAPSQEDEQNVDSTEDSDSDYNPFEEGEVETAPDDATKSSWGGQIIDEDEYVGTGAVIQIGDSAYKLTGFTQHFADRYSASINKAVEALDGRARLFTVLGLENTTFMLQREDRLKMGCKPEEDAVEYMYSNIDPRVHTVSVYNNLVAHNSEYIAFRTDHHWTALGAYYAYEAWCEEAGFEPVPLSEYEVKEFPGFLGSYYAKASKSSLLKEDNVIAYVPPGNITLYLSDSSSDAIGWEQSVITDLSHASSGTKYLVFLAGDHAKGTFINDDITDGSSCVVVKTSIGNPFVYFLTQHYQYVYVVDIRYYSGRKLTSFVDHFDIDDVIFMHGTGLAMSSGGNDLIAKFCK